MTAATTKLDSRNMRMCTLSIVRDGIIPEVRQGYPDGIERDPWNLTRLRAQRDGGVTP
jgi:hypothetical protein